MGRNFQGFLAYSNLYSWFSAVCALQGGLRNSGRVKPARGVSDPDRQDIKHHVKVDLPPKSGGSVTFSHIESRRSQYARHTHRLLKRARDASRRRHTAPSPSLSSSLSSAAIKIAEWLSSQAPALMPLQVATLVAQQLPHRSCIISSLHIENPSHNKENENPGEGTRSTKRRCLFLSSYIHSFILTEYITLYLQHIF